MAFKTNDKVWVVANGDRKPGVIKTEDKARPKVEVTYTDVLTKKEKTMSMRFPIGMLVPRE